MRPRWRVRTLMLAVLATACLLGVLCGMWRQTNEYRRRAAFHQRAASVLSDAGGSGCMDVPGADEDLFEPALRRAYLYHRDLGSQYSRAARRPWLSVRPIPAPGWAYPEALREVLDPSTTPP